MVYSGGMKKEVRENWAVSIDRVREFFLAQEDVLPLGLGYVYKSCVIQVRAQRSSGPLAMERTQLYFSGEAEDLEEIRRRFFLRFLSAGG